MNQIYFCVFPNPACLDSHVTAAHVRLDHPLQVPFQIVLDLVGGLEHFSPPAR